jgi:hypothetical protein
MLKWTLALALLVFFSSCQQTGYNPGYIISDTQGEVLEEKN